MLNFYNVDKDYITYLQQSETNERGFSRIPNMDYTGRNQKFICGIVKNINGLNYFVPITSYKIQKSENILINIPTSKTPIKGSLRFNYMFPVPTSCIQRVNISSFQLPYRRLVIMEYNFVKAHEPDIKNKADEVYNKIVNRTCSNNLLNNSCDFTLLESKCKIYETAIQLDTSELPSTTVSRLLSSGFDESKIKEIFELSKVTPQHKKMLSIELDKAIALGQTLTQPLNRIR